MITVQTKYIETASHAAFLITNYYYIDFDRVLDLIIAYLPFEIEYVIIKDPATQTLIEITKGSEIWLTIDNEKIERELPEKYGLYVL